MPRPKDLTDAGFEDWPFLSVHFWGEPAVGNWTLEVSQVDLGGKKSGKESGMLINWQLVFYGTESLPFADDVNDANVPSLNEVETDAEEDDEEEELEPMANDVDGGGGGGWELTNPDIEYPAIVNGAACHPECLNGCKGGSGNHQCVSCRNFLFESRCVARCPAKSYGTIDRLCLRCHRDCVTCYGAGKRHCLSCRQKGDAKAFVDVVKGGSCVAKCSTGYFPLNATSCVECASHCDACNDDGVTCNACANNFLLSADKKCVASCPEGQFPDPSSRSCLPCHETCLTCVGSRPSQCGLCKDVLFYYERSCVQKCPSGYFADPGKLFNIYSTLQLLFYEVFAKIDSLRLVTELFSIIRLRLEYAQLPNKCFIAFNVLSLFLSIS